MKKQKISLFVLSLFFVVFSPPLFVFASNTMDANNTLSIEEAFSEEDDNTALPPLPDMDETEAGGACNTPACLQTEEATDQTASVMMQMCREALPEHCQQVLPQFTACTPTDDMGWGQITGLSAGSCITGLWDGVVDTAFFFGGMAKGLGTTLWRSLRSSEHWEETKDMGSFLMEDLQSISREDLKGMFDKGFWNEADKFINCLNTRGRYEYLCEGASQVLAGGVGAYGAARGVGFLGKKAMNVPRRARWMAQGGRGKLPILNRKERRAQIAKLKEMLARQDEMDVTKLSPFMLNRLTKKQFQTQVDFSKLTDAQAMHLSRRRLSQIHPTEYAKMDITKLQQTIDRMPDEGFKALMTGNSASQIPFASVERNLYRIPSDQISNIKNIHKVDPGVFRRSMSSERLRGLNWNQARVIRQGPQYQKLAKGQKEIVDDAIVHFRGMTYIEAVRIKNAPLYQKLTRTHKKVVDDKIGSDTIEEQKKWLAKDEQLMTWRTNKQLNDPAPAASKTPAAQTTGGKSFIEEPASYRTARANEKTALKNADEAEKAHDKAWNLRMETHKKWLDGDKPFEKATESRAKQQIEKYKRQAREAAKEEQKYQAEARKYDQEARKILQKTYGPSKAPDRLRGAAKNLGRTTSNHGGKD